jgi:hypothetical protein
MAIDLATSGGRKDEDAASPRTQPTSAKVKPEPRFPEPRPPAAARGTLTPADLAPTWRGQVQRTGL